MAKVKINKKRCKGCKLCIAVCPRKNLEVDKILTDAGVYPVIVIKEDDCSGCGFCFVMCPDVAIEVEA